MVWERIEWEPVGPGLVAEQCRGEMEAEGEGHIYLISSEGQNPPFYYGMYRIIYFSCVELLLLLAFLKIRIQPCVIKKFVMRYF